MLATMTASRRTRVLVVDDELVLLEVITDFLTEHGLQVVGTATDGAEVLDAIAKAVADHGGVDVVVLDERMPRMSGIEAAWEIKRVHRAVRVVMYSAFAGMLDGKPRQAGVSVEVSKGSNPIDLVYAVRSDYVRSAFGSVHRIGCKTLVRAEDVNQAPEFDGMTFQEVLDTLAAHETCDSCVSQAAWEQIVSQPM